MSNFVHPHGGPYALKDQLPHDELNDLIEQFLKAPNFDEGSSHAPTADLELSGSNGGGFLFADMFPMRGETDVTDGLIFDAGTSGFVRLKANVALDVFGAATFKTGNATTHETGTTETWASGATLTVASGATWNLTGTGLVRGSLTIKSSGGPGSLFVETGCTFQVNANATVTIATNDWNWTANNKQTYLSGAEVAGPVIRSGRDTKSGASAQTAWRYGTLSASANADVDVSKDVWEIPATLTGSHTYRVCHSGVAGTQIPTAGQIIHVRHGDPAGVSAHNPKLERESGQDLWLWGMGYHGGVTLVFDGTDWQVLFGANVDGASLAGTGWYGS